MYYNNIIETIGNTPLVKLNKVTAGIKATVLAKVESFNPGNSIKDRIGLKMIDDAEKSGKLKPGGTIIEGTSGNTGMGLALVAIARGYKCIFTTTDKQSKEKMDILRAVGAEVIVCPTNVAAEDARSYYSVAKKLSEEIPNSFYPNQYDNLSNREAHYESTGPEIWKQTDGKITHLVVGAGTGGTICGTGKFLKEKNPNIKVLAIDTYGSVLKKFHETGKFDEKEIHPYITEGIGEDIVPKNYDFSVIDFFEKVSDKDGAIMARRITKEEGIFVGYSAGSAVQGLLQLKNKLTEKDLVVVIFHDHGSRYVGKLYNDDWMRDRGFLPKEKQIALDLIAKHKHLKLVTVDADSSVEEAIAKMQKYNISQIPVVRNLTPTLSEGEGGKREFVGSISDSHLFAKFVENPNLKSEKVEKVMQPSFPFVQPNDLLQDISRKINKENPAVLVNDVSGTTHIITKYDIIDALAK